MNKKRIVNDINRAKEVQRSLESSSVAKRNEMLSLIAKALSASTSLIIEANKKI